MKLSNFRFIGICAAIMAAALLLFVPAEVWAVGGRQTTTPSAGGRGSITVMIYDRGNVPTEEGTNENNRWTRWINENGPVNVTYIPIPRQTPEQRLNVLFASRSAPDLLVEFSAQINNAHYQDGLIVPVDDMIERYSTVYKNFLTPALRKVVTYPDGKMYQFGREQDASPQRGILIRQDWLDKLNLRIPSTIDEFYQVAKAFAEQDPDGNGIRDTYGVNLDNQMATLAEVFSVMYTSHTLVNGEYVHAWDQLAAFYTFVKRLYDEGIVDRDFLSDSNGSRASQNFLSGKVGIDPGGGNVSVEQYTTLRQNAPGAVLVNMQYPSTQFGRKNPHLNNPLDLNGTVNADAKDQESIMKYIDFMYSFDAAFTLTYGFEGIHYNMVNGIPIRIQENYNQISYTGDLRVWVPTSVLRQYASRTMNFDVSIPVEREIFEMRKSKFRLFDYSLPGGNITIQNFLPQLPQDLLVIRSNLLPSGGAQHQEFFQRAVVGGTSYTVDMALRDARAAWERGGGNRIDDWYSNWYRQNRNTAVLYPDLYEIMRQQDMINWYAP